MFGQIRTDPTGEQIYTLGLNPNVSHDGGKTFPVLRGMHGDHVVDRSTRPCHNVNDGGFYKSADAGKSWRFAVSAGGSQFYNVALDTTTPAWAYGSIQDVGSRRGRVDTTKGRDRIPAVEWSEAPGGEGANQAIDPQNPNIVYSHGFYGNFTREDLGVSAAPVRGNQQAGRGRGAPGA